MSVTDRFTPEETQRIVGLTGKQLDYWDRLRLVSPRKEQGSSFYDFGDLISLRTVKQLIEKGVPANRLRRALAALRERLAQVQAPLAELRVLSDGKDIVVEHGGTSGKQFVWIQTIPTRTTIWLSFARNWARMPKHRSTGKHMSD